MAARLKALQQKKAQLSGNAGVKGLGAFAARDLEAGEYVGPYVGTLTTDEETIARYCAENILSASLECDYLFHVNDTYSIDAQNSTHFSRYFNHAEHGNLEVEVDEEARRIEFRAARAIAAHGHSALSYGTGYLLRAGVCVPTRFSFYPLRACMCRCL